MQIAQIRSLSSSPRTPRQIRALFSFMFFHPDATLKKAAKAIGVSHLSARLAWSRLKRKHDLTKLCPNCFTEAFDGKVCHVCGFTFEREEPVEPAVEFQAKHETVYVLKNNGLKLRSDAVVIQKFVDHGFRGHKDERKFEKLKRKLMEYYGDPKVESLALKILSSEYRRFKADYPKLLSKRGTDDLMVRNVIKHLRPWLVPLRPPEDGVSEFQSPEFALK